MLKYTVIVLTFNEEATIIPILELVNAQKLEGVDLEVLVVDDGSSDRTLELLESQPPLYSKLIKMPKKGGKGAAIKAGLEQASGEYVLFQDADLEYSPSEYAKLLRPVFEFGADLVMSSRFVAPEFTRVAYFWNKVGNRLITLFFNILNNTTFTDIYSCYMLFRSDLVPASTLRCTGWDQHAESCPLPGAKPAIFTRSPSATMDELSRRGRKSAGTTSSPFFEPSSFVGFLGLVRTIRDLPVQP